jgi:peroxisomal 2,4-dienoyl-CoA reductase
VSTDISTKSTASSDSPSAKGLEESAQALAAATGGQCIATPADVRDPEQVARAVESTIKAFGRIDFVICGAAGNL